MNLNLSTRQTFYAGQASGILSACAGFAIPMGIWWAVPLFVILTIAVGVVAMPKGGDEEVRKPAPLPELN